jgi:hypothetical protein
VVRHGPEDRGRLDRPQEPFIRSLVESTGVDGDQYVHRRVGSFRGESLDKLVRARLDDLHFDTRQFLEALEERLVGVVVTV